jgi:hypothetical protein
MTVTACNTFALVQAEVEEFASYTAEKISKFSQEFLYVALMRKLLQETTKSLEARKVKPQ